MKIGLIFIILGVIMFAYSYLRYKNEQRKLALVKKEDLVTYYLDLALNLLPVPLWSAVIGILLAFIGLIVVLVNIPVIF